MRDALEPFRERAPSHVGLAYDVWAPVERHDGKVATGRGEQQEWLARVCGIPIDEHYRVAFERWRGSFEGDGSCQEVETTSRLLVGHGNPSATDVGLTVHHTWGVPMIPGSALAGVVAHYVHTELGGPEPERARWLGPRYPEGVVIEPPGELYGCLFGVPELGSDRGAQGLVTFHDALYVPEPGGAQPFGEDVLTVHQKQYYDRRGAVPPTDHDDPNPVSFLTVRRGVRFLLALSGPAHWRAVAMKLLLEALARRGVGGKTSSGYGRLREVKEGERRAAAEASGAATGPRAATAVPVQRTAS